MFGSYPVPFRITEEEICLGVDDSDPQAYFRKGKGVEIRKHLSSLPECIYIQPVEPANLPDPSVARHLEIRFPVQMVGPGEEKRILLTFPVEIGVIALYQSENVRLDIFTYLTPKFSLYGEPDSGIITRWYEAVLSPDPGSIDPLREGILQLTIRNSGRKYLEVSRAVFDLADIVLYYGTFAAMNASMEVFSSIVAETKVLDQPLREGMTRFIPDELSGRSLIIEKKGYMMEHGVAE